MTPKEKAKEIYNGFDMIIYTDQDHLMRLGCMRIHSLKQGLSYRR